MTKRLMRLPEVLDVVGLRKTGFYDLMNRGGFPQPIKLSDDGRAVAWVDSEVQEWIEARIRDRDLMRTKP